MLTGTLFLHGGNEFHASSHEFDEYFINAVAGLRVGIFPGASTSKRDEVATVAFASGYFSLFGVNLTQVTPEEFDNVDALILPGGSPHKLLEELTPFEDELRQLHDRGVIYGASAGAMVLGRGFTLGGRWQEALGLGSFEALVHFAGQLPGRAGLLYGLPEAGGLVVAKSGAIIAKSSGVQIQG